MSFVVVESVNDQLLVHKNQLNRYGLKYTENRFIGRIKYQTYIKLRDYCQNAGLNMYIDNTFSERSYDYRKKFFDYYKPIYKDYFFCSYCGKPVKKDNVSVDHLYPIHKVKKSMRLTRKLDKMGLSNVNDVKNLVPSCAKCNNHKRTKMGIWIVKGRVGRIQKLWIPRHVLRIAGILTALFFAFCLDLLSNLLIYMITI